MQNDLEQAVQACENRKVELLSALVPKAVTVTTIVSFAFTGACVCFVLTCGIDMAWSSSKGLCCISLHTVELWNALST